MFEFDLTDELRDILGKLSRKNPVLADAVNKKIKEIVSRDKNTINIYKNLKYSFKNYKRSHITGNIVLLFSLDLNKNFILFVSLKHIDDVYKR